MKKIYFFVTALLMSVSTFAGLNTQFSVDEAMEQVSITAYSISGELETAVIDNDAQTVLVKLAEGTDVSALVPTFTISDGATALLEQVSQTSGESVVNFGDDAEVVYTIINGESTADWTVSIEFGTSVKEDALANVSLFPNPVNNELTITNLDNASQIIVSNIIGQVVLSQPVSEIEVKISTSELNNGIYIVTVIAENGSSHSERIIKK